MKSTFRSYAGVEEFELVQDCLSGAKNDVDYKDGNLGGAHPCDCLFEATGVGEGGGPGCRVKGLRVEGISRTGTRKRGLKG